MSEIIIQTPEDVLRAVDTHVAVLRRAEEQENVAALNDCNQKKAAMEAAMKDAEEKRLRMAGEEQRVAAETQKAAAAERSSANELARSQAELHKRNEAEQAQARNLAARSAAQTRRDSEQRASEANARASASASAELAAARQDQQAAQAEQAAAQQDLVAAGGARVRAEDVRNRANFASGLLRLCNRFVLRWNDQRSGARMNGSFFQTAPDPGYLVLGDYAQGDYGAPRGHVLTLKADGPVPWERPVDYVLVWNDSKSGARMDGSFWRPIPPPGFRALGDVAQSGYGKPGLDRVVCIHESFAVADSRLNTIVWADWSSGARMDGSFWFHEKLGVFVAQWGYNSPGDAWSVSFPAVEAALGPPANGGGGGPGVTRRRLRIYREDAPGYPVAPPFYPASYFDSQINVNGLDNRNYNCVLLEGSHLWSVAPSTNLGARTQTDTIGFFEPSGRRAWVRISGNQFLITDNGDWSRAALRSEIRFRSWSGRGFVCRLENVFFPSQPIAMASTAGGVRPASVGGSGGAGGAPVSAEQAGLSADQAAAARSSQRIQDKWRQISDQTRGL